MHKLIFSVLPRTIQVGRYMQKQPGFFDSRFGLEGFSKIGDMERTGIDGKLTRTEIFGQISVFLGGALYF